MASPDSDPLAILQAKVLAKQTNTNLRSLVRLSNKSSAEARDTLLHSVLSTNPSAFFKTMRGHKASAVPTLHSLTVGDTLYEGDLVPTGFHDALKDLKVPDMDPIVSLPAFISAKSSCDHILEICKSGPAIPTPTLDQSSSLLKSLSKDVLDLTSISPNHYLMAGPPGIAHFHALLSILIQNVNLSALPDLNSS